MTILTRPNTTTGFTGFLLTICLGCATWGSAGAADFDGSRELLCVPTDAVQCEGAGECVRTEVEDLNLPKFVTVDFKGKKLRGTVEGSTSEQITAIQSVHKLDGRTVVQGAENGRGWSIVIDGLTGDMSVAIAGDDVAFVLFGVCQAR